MKYGINLGISENILHRSNHLQKFFFLKILFIYLCLFRAILMAHGGSQARGQIGAVAAGLHHSHSNTRFKLCLWPTLQLMAMLDLQPTEQGQGSNLRPHGY